MIHRLKMKTQKEFNATIKQKDMNVFVSVVGLEKTVKVSTIIVSEKQPKIAQNLLFGAKTGI